MKRVLFTRAFWLDAAERSIKTAAQFAVGTGLLGGTDLLKDGTSVWLVAAAAATGALLSLVTSVASAPVSGMSPASVVPPGA